MTSGPPTLRLLGGERESDSLSGSRARCSTSRSASSTLTWTSSAPSVEVEALTVVEARSARDECDGVADDGVEGRLLRMLMVTLLEPGAEGRTSVWSNCFSIACGVEGGAGSDDSEGRRSTIMVSGSSFRSSGERDEDVRRRFLADSPWSNGFGRTEGQGSEDAAR